MKRILAAVFAAAACLALFQGQPAAAAAPSAQSAVVLLAPEGLAPSQAAPPAGDAGDTAGDDAGISVNVEAPDLTAKGNGNVVVLLLGIALLSVVPSLVILLTSFPRIVIVLSMARNALGLPMVPPNQVITGLALFLTFFVMGPTLSEMNKVALQPLLDEKISAVEAVERAQEPLREFMLEYTREQELKLMLDAAEVETPVERSEIPMSALIPAFLLSELRTAFIIGFAIFLPFLIIDLVVSSILQSLGLMMLPPTFVSLPFKVLLFVLAGGWTLVVESLLRGFQ